MIAMPVVRVVQVPIHQVVDVVAMRHRLVSAAWTMRVVFGVATAAVVRSASGRVVRADLERTLSDVSGLAHPVQVAVVQIVDVVAVANSRMAAALTVYVVMTLMGFAHRRLQQYINTSLSVHMY